MRLIAVMVLHWSGTKSARDARCSEGIYERRGSVGLLNFFSKSLQQRFPGFKFTHIAGAKSKRRCPISWGQFLIRAAHSTLFSNLAVVPLDTSEEVKNFAALATYDRSWAREYKVPGTLYNGIIAEALRTASQESTNTAERRSCRNFNSKSRTVGQLSGSSSSKMGLMSE